MVEDRRVERAKADEAAKLKRKQEETSRKLLEKENRLKEANEKIRLEKLKIRKLETEAKNKLKRLEIERVEKEKLVTLAKAREKRSLFCEREKKKRDKLREERNERERIESERADKAMKVRLDREKKEAEREREIKAKLERQERKERLEKERHERLESDKRRMANERRLEEEKLENERQQRLENEREEQLREKRDKKYKRRHLKEQKKMEERQKLEDEVAETLNYFKILEEPDSQSAPLSKEDARKRQIDRELAILDLYETELKRKTAKQVEDCLDLSRSSGSGSSVRNVNEEKYVEKTDAKDSVLDYDMIASLTEGYSTMRLNEYIKDILKDTQYASDKAFQTEVFMKVSEIHLQRLMD